MQIVHSIVSWYMKQRLGEIELFKKDPLAFQQTTLYSLISKAQNTQFGKAHNFKTIKTEKDFKKQLPISDYETLKPYTEKIIKGERNVLWHSDIKWMAKSSGTSNDKSKFIPVSNETLQECHYKAARDVLAVYCNNFPDSQLFMGKGIILGGSRKVHQLNKQIQYGDLSAVLLQNMSQLGRYLSSIDLEISLLEDWEHKLDRLSDYYIPQRVSNISGVPSWLLLFLKHVLAKTGKSCIAEVWEHFELYIHGGVSFEPYKAQFQDIIGKPINYLQTYNASEGFFALQDLPCSNEMLLMLDLGIYFEFIPLSELGSSQPISLNLNEVEQGINYAMVITTQSGLWRYILGDTIQFTNLFPHRIKISGRIKQYLNAFGEELIVDNTDKAIANTCKLLNCNISEYTVAPYFNANKSGGHEWLIAFDKHPESLKVFAETLDKQLSALNSDYEAKRFKNMVISLPKINIVETDSFYLWLKEKGKLGGQHKIPRLSNKRVYLEEIIKLNRQLKKISEN